MNFRFLITLLFLNCSVSILWAQKIDSTKFGSASGLIRDSVRNFVMQGATVSVYQASDDHLLSYQLSTNFGRFRFKSLPVGIPLRMVTSYIGYASAMREFQIPAEKRDIDLKTINMARANILLDEVQISAKIPPMQMRGDTLEFNADAFKLDTNAVVEDMLRKLPGVTVWNDGVITVNGKQIKKLFVEGKEFFGGGSKIAIQNLAKNAVQKVQVYEDKSNSDPNVATTNMNIVLKKDKKSGYFGKIGGGLATRDHYNANGVLSLFTPKMQVSIVGATNDINKSANDVNSLLALNSFRGDGVDNNYFSDFTRQGENLFSSTGFSFLYDFAEKKDLNVSENQLKSNYFLRKTESDLEQKTKTLVTLNPDEQLDQRSSSFNSKKWLSQDARFGYDKRYAHNSFNSSFYLRKSEETRSSIDENSSINSLNSLRSKNLSQQDVFNTGNAISGNIKFVTHRYPLMTTGKSKSVNMEVEYSFELNNSDDQNKYETAFTATDTLLNRYFNRQYLYKSTNFKQEVVTNLNDFIALLQKKVPYFTADFRNTVVFNRNKNDNDIADLTNGGKSSSVNTNLTNISKRVTVNEWPGINFSKTISSVLDNRFSKILDLSLFAKGDIFMQKNTSQKLFQNIDRSYAYFTPSARISYSDFKYGGSRNGYSINYNTSVNYPDINQLAPLIDDINIYSINYGNLNLKPSYRHDLSLHYNYDNGKAKNPWFGDLDFSAGLIKNSISDSSNYDALGRTAHYPINVSGNKYASIKGSIRTAYKINEHQIQVAENSNFSYSQNPSSLNGKFYLSKSNNVYVSGDLVYSYKGIFTTNIGESFSNNNTTQENFSRYNFKNWKTYFNVVVNLPGKISLSSRLDVNNSKSSNAESINYKIWNIDAAYRFLKGDNGEIKFSAFDLLHENTNIINYIGNNSITSGTVNVLQQFFMVSIAYYPRKFGLGKK